METALPRPEDAEPADLLALMLPETPAAPPHAQAEALVQQFYQRFHGRAQATPTAKEVTQATTLLTAHGREKAQYLLTFSHQAAQATRFDPQVFGGILHYLDRALAAYDAQAVRVSQAAAQRTAADERACHERYLEWRQRELRRLRAALSSAELAALEATTRARLVAAGTVPCTLEFSVRFAVDDVLDAQAGLLSFAAWRQTQEDADDARC